MPSAVSPLPVPISGLVVLTRALSFAADKHRHQRRLDEDETPYINHPILVLEELVLAGVSDTLTLIGGVLHDTEEDTGTTTAQLDEKFGPDAASLVHEVSDDKSLPKQERKRLQVVHAPRLTYRAKLVKVADKIVNVRDMALSPPAHWNLKRRHAYFDWSREVVVALDLPATPQALALLERFEQVYALRPAA